MTQEIHFGRGALDRLRPLLDRLRLTRVFLVTGTGSFLSSGAAERLERLLEGLVVHRYSGFAENPRLDDAIAGVDALRASGSDVVVAVGGGTALDMAKLVNIAAVQAQNIEEIVAGTAAIDRPGLPLIAVPTTAGSGSEATHFAVVYDQHVKHSVASSHMLPTAAIVDPVLTWSVPPRLTAVTGLDALVQAIESYWCIHSTAASKAFARRAIELVLEHLETTVAAPTSASRRAMCKGAHFAGRAINITKTTGAHAISYPLTAHFGVPHGHAVALTVGEFFVYNSQVTEGDVADRRGAGYVREAIADLMRLLGCQTSEDCRSRISRLIRAVGLQTRLGELGIPCADAVERVAAEVNVERMANNPRNVARHDVQQLIAAVC
jgi:alcohol dehydrogenase class IV